jgi:hypothetical protein
MEERGEGEDEEIQMEKKLIQLGMLTSIWIFVAALVGSVGILTFSGGIKALLFAFTLWIVCWFATLSFHKYDDRVRIIWRDYERLSKEVKKKP